MIKKKKKKALWDYKRANSTLSLNPHNFYTHKHALEAVN